MRNVLAVLQVLVVGIVAGGLLVGCSDSGEKPGRSDPEPTTGRQPTQPAKVDVRPDTPAETPVEQPAEKGAVELVVSAPSSAAADSEIEYALLVRNQSRVDLRNVVLTDVLPADVAYVSSTPTADVKGPLLTWTFDRIGPYGFESVQVRTRVTGTGAIENRATVRADGGLVHEHGATTQVAAAPPAAALLSVVQSCDPSVLVCDPITYRVRIENIGSTAASGVGVQANLPEGLLSDKGATLVSIAVGALPAGESRDLEYAVKAQDTGTYTNTVTVSDEGGGRATATCIVRATRPVLALRMEAPATAVAGGEIDVRVTLENNGDGPARAPRLQVDLPAGTRVVSASEGGDNSSGRAVVWTLATIDPGQSSTLSVRIDGATAGAIDTRATADAYCAEATSTSARTNVTAARKPDVPVEPDVPVVPAVPDNEGLQVVFKAPSGANAGETFECTVEVVNGGNRYARDLVVRQEVPVGAEYVSSTPRARLSGSTLTWDLGDLRAGERVPLTVTLRATSTGQVESTAELTAADGRRHSDRAVTTIREPALLDLVATCDETTLLCDPVSIKLVTNNRGARSMDDVRVSIQLPDGLVTDRRERTVTARVGRLTSRQSREVTLKVRAERTGTFEIAATATNASGERTEATCTTRITQPVLAVTAKGPEEGSPGESLEYTITVENTGDAAAADCVIEVPLPAGSTFVAASHGGRKTGAAAKWELGTLETGKPATVTLTLRADEVGTMQSTVRATGYCCDEATAAVTSAVTVPPPDLRLKCELSKAKMRVGKTADCTITVVNRGSADATNVEVRCNTSRLQEAVSAEGPAGVTHTLSGRRVTFATIRTLRAGERAEFRVVVSATDQGEARVTAVVRADGLTDPMKTESDPIEQIRRK